MDQSPLHRRLWLAQLGLLLGSTILTLAAVELGLRIHYRCRLRQFLGKYIGPDGRPPILPADVPGLIYTHAPHVRGANSQGYIDAEHSLEKPHGVSRIVVIGDCVARGQGVGLEQSFPKLLEHDLNRSPAGVRYVSLVEHFSSEPAKHQAVRCDGRLDPHYNAAGLKIYAAVLAPALAATLREKLPLSKTDK